jgi:uncharacterized 2Fe-2S/4Fe-4S cluster protein (DUF4445 family)
MSDSEVKKWTVKFLPENISVLVDDEANLLQVALEAGVHIDAMCGGAGACGKCAVKVLGETTLAPSKAKKSAKEPPPGTQLACLTQVKGNIEVEVPATLRLSSRPALEDAIDRRKSKLTFDMDSDLLIKRLGPPDVRKLKVKIMSAAVKRDFSDLDRLFKSLQRDHDMTDTSFRFNMLKNLPDILKKEDGLVTVTVSHRRCGCYWEDDSIRCTWMPEIDRVEAGDTTDPHVFLAIDVGTTTIWAQLADGKSGAPIAVAADYNQQYRYGADVINRIIACGKDGKDLPKLQKAAVDTINQLIEELMQKTGLDCNAISHVVAAGNTTMTHILLGLDPRSIRIEPHQPVVRMVPRVPATDLGIRLTEDTMLYTLPSVTGWLGGDVVAGVLASGMHREDPMTLFVDLGTNGEMVFGNKDFLVAASCSAGPAFEGGEIRHGSRAVPGAIEDFSLGHPQAEPMIITIGQQQASGICGTGLINSVAELYLTGVLDRTGNYDFNCNSPRLRERGDVPEYVLVNKEHSATGEDIVLDEMDLDNLMRAKAAVYAGIRTLLVSVGVEFEDVERVILAGGFGSSVDVARAIMLGLLPDIPIERFGFIGNSSLHGARLVGHNRHMREEAETITMRMTYLDLGRNSIFADEYSAAQFLPHTHLKQFPSVAKLLERSKS